jgi:hypothetical protein
MSQLIEQQTPLPDGVVTGKKFGYGANGSTVTQATNRSTGVTINSLCGQITTNNASLAAESSAVFTVTNSKVASTDVVVACIQGGTVALNTDVVVSAVAAGSFALTVVNGNVAAGTAETGTIVINFAVIKAVTS